MLFKNDRKNDTFYLLVKTFVSKINFLVAKFNKRIQVRFAYSYPREFF